MDSTERTDSATCPACGRALAGSDRCANCGLDQRSPGAGRLSEARSRLFGLDDEIRQLTLRREATYDEMLQMRAEVMPSPIDSASLVPPPPGVQAHARPRAEWDPASVREWLLWLGVALLALSALTLTAVAWTRFGDVGRMGIVVAATVAATAAAVALRDRLPATSQALTALALFLAVVDVEVLRRSGVGAGLSDEVWWGIGLAIVGVLALVLGRFASRNAAYSAAAIAFPWSAANFVALLADTAWLGALLTAGVVLALVVAWAALRSGGRDPVATTLLAVQAFIGWGIAVLLVLVAHAATSGIVDAIPAALALLVCALAPALAVAALSDDSRELRIFYAAVVVAAAIASVMLLVTNPLDSATLLVVATLLGAIVVVGAMTRSGTWRAGALIAGAGALAPGIFAASAVAIAAGLGPLGWWDEPWTGGLEIAMRWVAAGPEATSEIVAGWQSVTVLLVATVTAGIGGFVASGRAPRVLRAEWPFLATGPWCLIAGALGLAAVWLVPIAADTTALTALIITSAVGAIALVAVPFVERIRSSWMWGSLGLAGAAGVGAAGLAALEPQATIVWLATLGGAAVLAALASRNEALRVINVVVATTAGLGLVGVLVSMRDDGAGGTTLALGALGLSLVVAGGVVFLVGVHLRKDTVDGVGLEVTGAAGVLVGLGAALNEASVDDARWLAWSLTITVVVLGVAALRRDRNVLYGVGALGAALAATWTWLDIADVNVVEAYTLSAAAAVFLAGALAWRDLEANSWRSFGPALVLALGPTTLVAIDANDDVRAILVVLAALVIAIVGALRRLQAPLVISGIALVLIGLDTLGPAAARLPRWLVLGAAGLLLLYLGATFERRRQDIRSLRERLEGFT